MTNNEELKRDIEFEDALNGTDPLVLSKVTARAVRDLLPAVKAIKDDQKSMRAEVSDAFNQLPCRSGDCPPQNIVRIPPFYNQKWFWIAIIVFVLALTGVSIADLSGILKAL